MAGHKFQPMACLMFQNQKVTQSLTQWEGDLLSCSGQQKTILFLCGYKVIGERSLMDAAFWTKEFLEIGKIPSRCVPRVTEAIFTPLPSQYKEYNLLEKLLLQLNFFPTFIKHSRKSVTRFLQKPC